MNNLATGDLLDVSKYVSYIDQVESRETKRGFTKAVDREWANYKFTWWSPGSYIAGAALIVAGGAGATYDDGRIIVLGQERSSKRRSQAINSLVLEGVLAVATGGIGRFLKVRGAGSGVDVPNKFNTTYSGNPLETGFVGPKREISTGLQMKDIHTVDGFTLLDRFSEKVGASNFKNWDGFHPIIDESPVNMANFIKPHLDDADIIHFNMDGFRANNFKKFIKRSGGDLGSVPGRDNWLRNVTNWEFNTIVKSDSLRNKTIFYDTGGTPMPNKQVQEIFNKAYRSGNAKK